MNLVPVRALKEVDMHVHLFLASRFDSGERRPLLIGPRLIGRSLTCAIAVGLLFSSAWICVAQTSTPESPDKPRGTILLPAVNRPPDANDRMEMQDKQQHKVNFDAANAARLKQMAEDSDALLTMAMALKAEVDNSPDGKLSPNALRKAEMIERLARGVKEKMKLTVAPN